MRINYPKLKDRGVEIMPICKNKKNLCSTIALPVVIFCLVFTTFYASNLYAKEKAAKTEKQDKTVEQAKEPSTKPATDNFDKDSFVPLFRDYSDLDTFAEMQLMHDNMERLFTNTLNRLRQSPGFNAKDRNFPFLPKADFSENKDTYTVRMDVPGINKSDLKIKVDGNLLMVSGKRDSRQETVKDDKVISAERSHGEFSRGFALPGGFDKDTIKAQCKDGVLVITIPKTNTPPKGEFTVKIE